MEAVGHRIAGGDGVETGGSAAGQVIETVERLSFAPLHHGKDPMISEQNRADFEQVGPDLVSRQVNAGLYGRQKRKEALEWLRTQSPEYERDEPSRSRWGLMVAFAALVLFCMANLVFAMQMNQRISDLSEQVAQLGKLTGQSDKQPQGKDDIAARLDSSIAKVTATTDAIVVELVSHRASIATLAKNMDELKARAAAIPPRKSAPGAKAK
jgi:hypothetical protein